MTYGQLLASEIRLCRYAGGFVLDRVIGIEVEGFCPHCGQPRREHLVISEAIEEGWEV